MNEDQKQNLADTIGVLLAAVMVTISLFELVPAGMWLYLIGLVSGTVILTNKFSRIFQGE